MVDRLPEPVRRSTEREVIALVSPGAAELQGHWEQVYSATDDAEFSWYQPEPGLSLALIREARPAGARVIDVGGGASVLVDRLLALGYQPAVLDISETALARARARLGASAESVEWIVADISVAPGLGRFDVWHDRAVFHFLTKPEERRHYRALAERTVPSGGHLIIGTFAPDGPARCSGLPVCRFDAAGLEAALGPGFRLLRSAAEPHATPTGKVQPFVFGLFQRL
jgi:SAM-dependent methyltransferase